MKRDSKESIERQIDHYTTKHHMLDDELVAEERRRAPNALRIRQLKKLKLMCKDKLTVLGEQLEQLSKPKRPLAEVILLPAPQPIAAATPARLAASR